MSVANRRACAAVSPDGGYGRIKVDHSWTKTPPEPGPGGPGPKPGKGRTQPGTTPRVDAHHGLGRLIALNLTDFKDTTHRIVARKANDLTEADADEIVSESIERYWKRCRSDDPARWPQPGREMAFLRGIRANVLREVARGRRRRGAWLELAGDRIYEAPDVAGRLTPFRREQVAGAYIDAALVVRPSRSTQTAAAAMEYDLGPFSGVVESRAVIGEKYGVPPRDISRTCALARRILRDRLSEGGRRSEV